MKALLITFLAAALALSASAGAQKVDFNLTISGADSTNSVYVPGVGAIQPSSDLNLIPLPLQPPHYYVASYYNNVLWGLAASKGSSVGISEAGSDQTVNIRQNLQGSRVFLVFSKGDYKNIEKNIGLVESGAFLLQNVPSFAFGSIQFLPVKILLDYQDIDLSGDFTLQSGTFQIILSNEGLTGTKPLVRLRVV
ncbi:MAG: hypothetical protein HY518_04015 [Candidatus Aenigmarchaeota archaeon]|nr:hypothetical protein [Candidatus Aenigmarchaeota archaeon]